MNHQSFSALTLVWVGWLLRLVLVFSSDPPFQLFAAAQESAMVAHGHIGNSMQYFNDCPRLLEQIIQASGRSTQEDSCLRPGGDLSTIFSRGVGVAGEKRNKVLLPAAQNADGTYDTGQPTVQALLNATNDWDFLILNDHTQHPAREETRNQTLESLQQDYLPWIDTNRTTVIFLQTPAYRVENVKESNDLGTFDDFTELMAEGYRAYQAVIPNSLVAPVGIAFQEIRNNNMPDSNSSEETSLFHQLYNVDDFHPSPHGTYLQSCVLYCTMFHEPCPDVYSCDWWDQARYMQPPDQDPLPLPSHKEAQVLRQVANSVCNVSSLSVEESAEEGGECGMSNHLEDWSPLGSLVESSRGQLGVPPVGYLLCATSAVLFWVLL